MRENIYIFDTRTGKLCIAKQTSLRFILAVSMVTLFAAYSVAMELRKLNYILSKPEGD